LLKENKNNQNYEGLRRILNFSKSNTPQKENQSNFSKARQIKQKRIRIINENYSKIKKYVGLDF
jgi:hypothetical protein